MEYTSILLFFCFWSWFLRFAYLWKFEADFEYDYETKGHITINKNTYKIEKING